MRWSLAAINSCASVRSAAMRRSGFAVLFRMMAIWRAIQDKPANSYVLKWRYNLASPDRDALMNGRFAPEAAVHVVGGTGWPAVRTTPVERTSRFGSFVPTSDIACRERLSFGGEPAADG